MPSSRRSDPVDLTGRHLFVTGGTGFLGRSLLDYLGEAAAHHGDGFRVDALTRDADGFVARFPQYGGSGWLNFVRGDLAELPVSDYRYTDLIHAAADTHNQHDKFEWFRQLVDGTRNVLDFARDHQIGRVLFISSGAVYGRQPADVAQLTEDWPHAPSPLDLSTVYGNGKRMGEHLCALYNERFGMNCVIARCFAIISEHIPLDGPYAAGDFLRDALERAEITVQGSGNAIRTYIDGRDMAHWMFTLMLKGKAGEAYNVGSDVRISLLELAEMIRSQFAPDKSVVVRKTGEIGRSVYVPSIFRAQSLGLQIETSLTDSIANAVRRV